MSERASQTFRSGKNNVMGVLIRRVLRTTFARAANQRASDRMALCRTWIRLLNRMHDQRADGSAGTFRAISQLVMQRLWKIDRSTDCHAIIMAEMTGIWTN